MLRGMSTRSCIAMEVSDILLKDMLRRAEPGRSYTPTEIADYTGLSVREITRVERDALRKLKEYADDILIMSGLGEKTDGN